MTANQIAYQKVQLQKRELSEAIRHNTEVENETYRSNVAREFETNRHNVQVENWNYASLFETNRHNLVTEAETERSHRAVEAETNRANVAREQETFRHNYATELQTDRSITETERHNRASEGISQQQVELGYSQLNETSRHNKIMEQESAARVSNLNAQTKQTEYQTRVDYETPFTVGTSTYSGMYQAKNAMAIQLDNSRIGVNRQQERLTGYQANTARKEDKNWRVLKSVEATESVTKGMENISSIYGNIMKGITMFME